MKAKFPITKKNAEGVEWALEYVNRVRSPKEKGYALNMIAFLTGTHVETEPPIPAGTSFDRARKMKAYIESCLGEE